MRKLFLALAFLTLASPALAEGRPGGCPHAWCGCWLAQHFSIGGALARTLWVAKNWAHIGQKATVPVPGTVVVWRHHVGKVTAVDGRRIKVLSGNDGHRVRERWRTTRGVIAYRWVGGNYGLAQRHHRS